MTPGTEWTRWSKYESIQDGFPIEVFQSDKFSFLEETTVNSEPAIKILWNSTLNSEGDGAEIGVPIRYVSHGTYNFNVHVVPGSCMLLKLEGTITESGGMSMPGTFLPIEIKQTTSILRK